MAGHASPYWMTFKQARQLGASVRKGERSSLVVYYGTAGRTDDAAGEGNGAGASAPGDRAEDGAAGTYRLLKSCRVFNAAQVEGLEACFHPEAEEEPGGGPDPIPALEAFFAAIGVEVVAGGDRACYVPGSDRIRMPDLSRFEGAEACYATPAHEHAHWTKAPHRLDRSFGPSGFGGEAHAKEELVAELAAVPLGQQLGFAPDHLDNHAAYLGSWLKVLRGDKRFVFRAGADAQRAVNFLVGAATKGRVALDAPSAAAETGGAPAREDEHEAA